MENPMSNRIRSWLAFCALAVIAVAPGCGAPPNTSGAEPRAAVDVSRGSELYGTYCVACHTAQVHWRDKRLVRSWDDLRYQVTRWQKIAGQNWSREEIDDVAAYLNGTFYEVPCPLTGCGRRNVGESGGRTLAQGR
jgi:mono/diheme cytochrome c family protein